MNLDQFRGVFVQSPQYSGDLGTGDFFKGEISTTVTNPLSLPTRIVPFLSVMVLDVTEPLRWSLEVLMSKCGIQVRPCYVTNVVSPEVSVVSFSHGRSLVFPLSVSPLEPKEGSPSIPAVVKESGSPSPKGVKRTGLEGRLGPVLNGGKDVSFIWRRLGDFDCLVTKQKQNVTTEIGT